MLSPRLELARQAQAEHHTRVSEDTTLAGRGSSLQQPTAEKSPVWHLWGRGGRAKRCGRVHRPPDDGGYVASRARRRRVVCYSSRGAPRTVGSGGGGAPPEDYLPPPRPPARF